MWLRFYDEAGNLVPLPEEAAEQQGLEQGLQQGLEQGLQQGARRQLLRLLTTRFGSVPEDVETRLQSAPKMLTIVTIFFLLHPGSVGTIQSTG